MSQGKNQFICDREKGIFSSLNLKIDTIESSLDKFIYKFKNKDNLIVKQSIKYNNKVDPTDSNKFNFDVPSKRCLNLAQEKQFYCIPEFNTIESNSDEKKEIFKLEEKMSQH